MDRTTNLTGRTPDYKPEYKLSLVHHSKWKWILRKSCLFISTESRKYSAQQPSMAKTERKKNEIYNWFT